MSVFDEYPKARKSIVTGNFLLLSIMTNKQSLMSVVKSTHEPRAGMILAWNSFVPLGCVDSSKNTPGDLCNCETITLSAPLMINVPFSVIYGILPK